MRREYLFSWLWSWALRRGAISIHCLQVGRRRGISVRRQVWKILDHSCWTIGGKMKNKVTRPISDNLNKSGWGWTNFCSLSGNIRSLGLGTVVEHSTCYVIEKRSTVQQFSGTVNTATKGSYWNHFWRRLFMKRFLSRNQWTLQNCEKSKSNKGSSCTDGWGLLERVRWCGSF